MNQKYLYLLLDLGSFIVPFLFSFYHKANFSRQWKFVLPAIVFTGLFFLVWDEIFTQQGVWGFNEKYTTGIYILSLPLEEVLFFICIPYACYFTHFALHYLVEGNLFQRHERIITTGIIGFSATIAILFYDRLYTFITFGLLALLLLYRHVNAVQGSGKFYFSFLILLIPFFIVNGILTGTGVEEPVVWYNNAETTGLRFGTIPFEDCFYAMLMLLMSITIAEKLEEFQLKKIALR